MPLGITWGQEVSRHANCIRSQLRQRRWPADACQLMGWLNCLQEDLRLAELVRVHGPKKWSQIASELKTNKSSKQVRARRATFVSAPPH